MIDSVLQTQLELMETEQTEALGEELQQLMLSSRNTEAKLNALQEALASADYLLE